MRWRLVRNQYLESGIFGLLTSEDGMYTFCTLEHSYDLKPKVTAGIHPCIPYNSPKHGCICPLLNAPEDQGHEFEVHIGNYNADSIGCILVGLGLGNASSGGKMLTSSKQAFEQIMKLEVTEIEIIDSI